MNYKNINNNEMALASYLATVVFLFDNSLEFITNINFPLFINKELVVELIKEYLENKDNNKFSVIKKSEKAVCDKEMVFLCPLQSIASTVNISGENKCDPLELSPEVKNSEDWFDKKASDKKEFLQSINTIKNNFLNDINLIKNIKETESYFFISILDAIFENYFSNISCCRKDFNDVSLYQFSRLICAYSLCILQKLKELNINEITDDDQVFYIVTGDASGIQKYIFNIKTPAKTSKLLRAKSFQIYYQTMMIASYIADKFNVDICNIVSFSGGKFTIVLPSLNNAKDIIKDAREKIEQKFLQEFLGELSFIISDGFSLSVKELKEISGQNLQNKISSDLNLLKQKKLQTCFKDGIESHKLSKLYNNIQQVGSVCSYCNQHPIEKDDGCSYCNQLIEDGRKLNKKKDGKKLYKKENEEPTTIDFPKGEFDYFTKNKDKIIKYSLDKYYPGFSRLFVPYYAPLNENGEVLTFEEIANDVSKDEMIEFNKLAMFKADVDFLGLVFGCSLGDNWSLLRYAELSSRMHAFFSYGLRTFIEKEYPNIYIVFSGGDDVCVIGQWYNLIEFVNKFHKKFEEFTNENPSLTISGGISLFSCSTPISFVVENAEECLERSKNRKGTDDKKIYKNAVTLFDRTIEWDKLDEQIKFSETLYDLTQKGKAGFIYGLIDYSDRAYRMSKVSNHTYGHIYDLMWQSSFKYSYNRNIEEAEKDNLKKDKNDISEKVKNKLKELCSCENKMINVKVAASIATYKNRKKGDKNE